jgi:hypothetical protein
MKTFCLFARGVVVAATFAASCAHAEHFTSAHASGMCLGKNGGIAVLASCGSSPDIQFGGYGEVKADGRCLSAQGEGRPLAWASCNNSTAQKWALSGRLNNEQGWCADIKGEAKSAGTEIIAYKCNGQSNQSWRRVATSNTNKPAEPATYSADAIDKANGIYKANYYGAEQALNCAGFLNVAPTRPSAQIVPGKDYVVVPHPAVKWAAEVDMYPQGRGKPARQPGDLCGYLQNPDVKKWYKDKFGL